MPNFFVSKKRTRNPRKTRTFAKWIMKNMTSKSTKNHGFDRFYCHQACLNGFWPSKLTFWAKNGQKRPFWGKNGQKPWKKGKTRIFEAILPQKRGKNRFLAKICKISRGTPGEMEKTGFLASRIVPKKNAIFPCSAKIGVFFRGFRGKWPKNGVLGQNRVKMGQNRVKMGQNHVITRHRQQLCA